MEEPDPLTEARETLVTLEDLERFLIVDIGQSGTLTLANTNRWANDVADVREKIDSQKSEISKLENIRNEQTR